MKMTISRAIVPAVLALSLQASDAATPRQNWLLALSKVDHVMAIVDPRTLEVVARVPVGPYPHEVIASPDGGTAYVSNTGYGSFREIDVIDLKARRALKPIDTLPLSGPHGLAYVGGKLWFTAQGSKAVGRLDPATRSIEWATGTGQDTTHMIYEAPDAKRIAATNVDSGTVSIFDNQMVQPSVPPTGVSPPAAKPRLDCVQSIVPVGKGAEGFDVSPDGHELWTATPAGILSIVNLDQPRRPSRVPYCGT